MSAPCGPLGSFVETATFELVLHQGLDDTLRELRQARVGGAMLGLVAVHRHRDARVHLGLSLLRDRAVLDRLAGIDEEGRYQLLAEKLHLVVAEDHRDIGLRLGPDPRQTLDRGLACLVPPPPLFHRDLRNEVLAAPRFAKLLVGIGAALEGMELLLVPLGPRMPHVGWRREQRARAR